MWYITVMKGLPVNYIQMWKIKQGYDIRSLFNPMGCGKHFKRPDKKERKRRLLARLMKKGEFNEV